MLKGYLKKKKKQIKTNKKYQCLLCKILSKKKKKTKTKTNVNVLCKPVEILSRPKKKKKNAGKTKSWHGIEKGNVVQYTLPPFLPHFLFILERLHCGGSREKIAGPHHFSLPLPLSSKYHFHPFSLLFSTLFFPSSLKSTHPNGFRCSLHLLLSGLAPLRLNG